MIIGGVVFLLVVVGAVFTVRSWQTPIPAADAGETEPLLQAVANLDDAYEAGGMDEGQYQQQREKLISELATIW